MQQVHDDCFLHLIGGVGSKEWWGSLEACPLQLQKTAAARNIRWYRNLVLLTSPPCIPETQFRLGCCNVQVKDDPPYRAATLCIWTIFLDIQRPSPDPPVVYVIVNINMMPC